MFKVLIKILLAALALHIMECKAQVSYDVDTDFNSGMLTFGEFYNLIPLDDGKIMVNGIFGNWEYKYNLVKLNSDGSQDLSFSIPNQYNNQYIVLAGQVFRHNGLYLHGFFNNCHVPDCSTTQCFNEAGDPCVLSDWSMPYTAPPYGITYGFPPTGLSLGDTAVLMNGRFRTDLDNPNNWQCLVRTNVDGSHDSTFPKFEALPSPDGRIVKKAPDGGYFMCGKWQTVNDYYSPGIIKLNAHFEIDTTFSSPFNSVNITQLMVDNDGRPWVSAWYASYDGVEDSTIYLMRLNQNGSIDSTFNMPTFGHFQSQYINGGIAVITLIDDGDGYIIGGSFSSINGVERSCLAKLTNEGDVVDGYFNENYIEYSVVYEYPIHENSIFHPPFVSHLSRLPDGGILVGGDFDFEINGHEVHSIMKLKEVSVGLKDDSKLDFNIEVFPNPAHSTISIRVKDKLKLKGLNIIEISDIQGRVVKSEIVDLSHSQMETMRISDLKKGLYFVNFKDNGIYITSQKLIVL